MANEAKLVVAVEAQGASQVTQAMQKLKEAGAQAEASTQRLASRMRSFADATIIVTQAIVPLLNRAKDMVVGFVQMADSVNMLKARLENMTGSVAGVAFAYQKLRQASVETGVSLETLGGLFNRIALAQSTLGASTSEIITVTKTVASFAATSGQSIASMSGALLQLGQALLSGKVQAEEFNSILDGMPQLAQAVASSLGLPFNEFIRKVKDGKLSSQELFDGILKASKQAEAQLDKMPLSLARVQNSSRLAFMELIAGLDNSTTFSKTFLRLWDKVNKGIEATTPIVIQAGAIARYALKSMWYTLTTTAGGIATVLSFLIEKFVNFQTEAIRRVVTVAKVGAQQIARFPLVGGVGKAAVGLTDTGLNTLNKVDKGFGGATQGLAKWTGKEFRKFTNVQNRGWSIPKEVIPQEPAPLGRGRSKTLVPSSPGDSTGRGRGKEKGTPKEAKKDPYLDSLAEMQKRLKEAQTGASGLRDAVALLAKGDEAGYKALLKKNDAQARFNELMGQYLGKGKTAYETAVKGIIANEQELKSLQERASWLEKMNQATQANNVSSSDLAKAMEAFRKGGIRAYDDLVKKQKEALDLQARIKELQGENPTADMTAQATALALKEQENARFGESIQAQVEQARTASQSIGDAFRTAFSNVTTTMINGTATWRDMMTAMLRQVAVQLLKVFAIQQATGLFNKFRTGGTAGATGGLAKTVDFLGNAFNLPRRAGGGSVRAGMPYLVGEQGREVFIPQSNGNISRNAASQPVNVSVPNVTVNVTSNAQGGVNMQELTQTSKMLGAMIRQEVLAVMTKETRLGGAFAR